MLLVDIGNSRIKWASFEDGRLGTAAAAEVGAWTEADWRAELERTGATRVVAAAVGAAAAREALVAASRHVIGRAPEFAVSTAEAAGVRNGYSNPAQLGVDRWLAVIGAFHRHRSTCCVVDAGTALTVDAVDGTGAHSGGFIVPGPRLMVESLLTRTSDLADRWTWDRAPDPATFPTSTRDAIEHGCLIALAGLIDVASKNLAARTAQVPRLIVTGGAADLLLPWLRQPAELVPDLVLQGLARIA